MAEAPFERARSSVFQNEAYNEQDDMEAQILELVRGNDQLKMETDLFSNYLKRIKVELNDDEEDPKSSKGKTRGGQKPKKNERLFLDAEQKHDIASQEMEEIRENIDDLKEEYEKTLDSLRASMEETDIRIAEIKKDAYEFKRDIVVGAENFRTGKTIAEKVMRYMDEKLRAKKAVIEKLRLKNSTLKSQIEKLQGQLKQKEEMGEVLHVIDFDQLKIENQQYLERIEDRNNELLRLKLTTGNTVQVLNSNKRRLNNLTGESEWLKSEIAQRKELLGRVTEEITRVEAEKEQAAKTNRRLKREMEGDNHMPQVLDYVSQKAEMHEAEKDLSSWRRKMEIAQMEVNRYAMMVKRAQMSED